MDFRDFEKRIVKIEKMELPGEAVQFKMAPVARLRELRQEAMHIDKARKAGVMALFYPNKNYQTNLILILRKTYKGVHSAQVGFPGGKIEKIDRSIKDAALRETEEEVGVQRDDIAVIKKLTQIYIPPSNFFVQPFLGVVSKTPTFVLEEREVEALIEVNLTHFMDESCITTRILSTSYATDLEVPAFNLNGHIVWGATAMMLNEVRDLLQRVL
ncbi:NUDIX hydrolase [Aequorivita viscosa]|uniref:8-oxo-dGTP pyrophosphatase MutT, NUDIX family n=1 Tax=Aequorivita viscosa TaxID=797419 RepID=A0A1M6NUU1_9FLAO|nr:CoA pyrophosphatase [Aequorivita viscosa]SDX48758.1 8-oxo-dGTP pyrophosphatase MutT, NUDIX family [Aequorivita viscosa]SHJ99483.1 8-oxo-dGTP pyrophosphatase MutT, NUDIX family [Aequorivita viscosa]